MDEGTRHEIDAVAERTLRDAGIAGPPVAVDALVEHLQLNRSYFDLQEPGFLDRVAYRLRVGGRKLVRGMLKKIKLVAVLLYDEKQIVIDVTVPDLRRDWPACHEMMHKALGWHRPYFYGDTAKTLHPEWHEKLEAEANYGASALMLCGRLFTEEASDENPSMAGVRRMAARYRKSLTITLRRFVEHGPDCVLAGLVSTPSWEDAPDDQPERWRYFFGSQRFSERFSGVLPRQVLDAVDANCRRRRGGPVADFGFVLDDDNGNPNEFHVESFYNTHYVLSLFVHVGMRSGPRMVLPSAAGF